MDSFQKKFMIGIAVIVILGMIIGFSVYFKGIRGFFSVMKFLMITIGIVIILGLLVYIVYLIFKKTSVDGLQINKQNAIRSCTANPPPHRQNLYFRGSNEWEHHKVGVIKGVCQITRTLKIPDGVEIIKAKSGKEVTKIKYKFQEEIEDLIAFKKTDAFFLGWFSSIRIVRVTKAERTSLNSDNVFLKSMAFSPELFGYLYLPSRYEDTLRIDKQIKLEVRRNTLAEFMKEEINLIQEAIAISPAHQKRLEQQNTQMLQSAGQTVTGGGGGK